MELIAKRDGERGVVSLQRQGRAMKTCRFGSLGLLLLLWLGILPTTARTQQPPLVTLRGTEVRTLRASSIDEMVYKVYVAVPEEFTGRGERFPAIYLLDAWNGFGIYLQTYRALGTFNEIPPLVLIGIAYEGTTSDHNYFRSRDFTPTHLSREELVGKYGQVFADLTPASGGSADFLRFLKTELIPFVEAEYPVAPPCGSMAMQSSPWKRSIHGSTTLCPRACIWPSAERTPR